MRWGGRDKGLIAFQGRPLVGGLLTPRKIAFDGGPGRRGNRYQALSGEGASEDEYKTYPYDENESSALLHGGG